VLLSNFNDQALSFLTSTIDVSSDVNDGKEVTKNVSTVLEQTQVCHTQQISLQSFVKHYMEKKMGKKKTKQNDFFWRVRKLNFYSRTKDMKQ